MFCSSCGGPVSPEHKFCARCGAAVVRTQPPAPAAFSSPENHTVKSAPAAQQQTVRSPAEQVPPVPGSAPAASVPVSPAAPAGSTAPAASTASEGQKKKSWRGEYCCAGIVETGPADDPFRVPAADELYRVIPEIQDHGLGEPLHATAVKVEKKAPGTDRYFEVMGGSNIELDVYITDSRVVFACEKYNKGNGGRWTGGLTAIALNAVTRGVEGRLRRGKILLGMVRYEWFAMLGYFRKVSWLTDERLLILYADSQKNLWRVLLTFKKQTDASLVAGDVLRRACMYRTRMTDELGDSEREFYDRFLIRGETIPVSSDPDTASAVKFPTYYKAPGGESHRPQN